jgi:hypothetical protein
MRTLTTAGKLAAVLTATTGVAVAGIQAPAFAHNVSWSLKSGITVYGSVYIGNSHKSINVCDDNANNLGITAEYWAGGSYYTLSDSNGSASGCGARTMGSAITSVNLFEASSGRQTGWKTVS